MMSFELKIADENSVRRVDMAQPIHLSIPLRFNGEQPNAFGLPRAFSEPFKAGAFVGDVAQGGSVNCSTVTINPHGNGTHTECVGHITSERLYVHEALRESFFKATLVSVPLCRKSDSLEHRAAYSEPDDWLVTKAALEEACEAWRKASNGWMDALIIRSLPNTTDKMTTGYDTKNAPYLSHEAACYIRKLGVQHLLVDFPSVDRGEDEGQLLAHHIFWSSEKHALPVSKEALERTITEMIFVPEDVKDGLYLLNLQIAPFLLDAAPSRPVLFPIILCSDSHYSDSHYSDS